MEQTLPKQWFWVGSEEHRREEAAKNRERQGMLNRLWHSRAIPVVVTPEQLAQLQADPNWQPAEPDQQ